MPTVKALGLEEHLKRVEPAPVYALVGQDDALRSRSLSLLEAFAAPADQPGSSVRRFEGPAEPRDVFGELRTVPFLGMQGRRAVVIVDGDAFLKSHGEPMAGYVQKPSRAATLIICLNKLDMRTSVAKGIESGGMIVDCAPPTARALVEAVGPNLLALEGELQKLALYAEGGRAITPQDVAEVVPQGRERSAFDLGSAIARGDAASALRLCDELLLRGEAKEGIIAILARQVRQYWQVKRLARQGAAEREIARQTGMPGFAARRAAEAVEGLSDDWFAGRLEMLARADYESKTTSLRSGEEEVWLESLLVRLCGRG